VKRLATSNPARDIVLVVYHNAAVQLRELGATVISEADEGERVFLEWFDERSSGKNPSKGGVV